MAKKSVESEQSSEWPSYFSVESGQGLESGHHVSQ